MTTSVWLFEPRSHGRKKEGARARNGAPLPGRHPSFRLPHTTPIGVFGMLLLTFPSGSFPAGTVMGWPESPEDDKQEHAKFSQHTCFGVPTQPVGMDARQVNRHANLANKHSCNTSVILFSPRPSERAAAITPARVLLEKIQRKSRVREWTPQNAPRIRAGVEKKDQKAELKKNQIRRRYAEKTSIFF